jgi:hypothetical protein
MTRGEGLRMTVIGLLQNDRVIMDSKMLDMYVIMREDTTPARRQAGKNLNTWHNHN